MEMPEGWKELNQFRVFDTCPPCNKDQIYRILDLMKEMAEALDYCRSILKDARPLVHESAHDAFDFAVSDSEEALNKFKEWK